MEANLLMHLFSHYDAIEILKLCIQSVAAGGLVAWHYEQSGMFSVKRACKLASNLKDCSEEIGFSSSTVNEERRMWDVIWKAKVPQKIRIFAWRAATNSLAVQVNRVNHHQTVLGLCTICGVQDESIFHALVTCPKARTFPFRHGEAWNIPGEGFFIFMGPDWLQCYTLVLHFTNQLF